MTTPDDDPSDRLLDSLLREQSRHRSVDPDLLEAIETALDARGPAAMRKSGLSRRGLLLASAAALVLAAGGIALWQGQRPGKRPELAVNETQMAPAMTRERRAPVFASDDSAQGQGLLPPMTMRSMKKRGGGSGEVSRSSSAPADATAQMEAAPVDAPEEAIAGSSSGNAQGGSAIASSSSPFQAVPEGVARVRFVAFDERVAGLRVKAVTPEGERAFPASGQPVLINSYRKGSALVGRLHVEGRTDAEGRPAYLEILLGSYADPLVVLLADERSQPGLGAVITDYSLASLPLGASRVFNATSEDLFLRVNDRVQRVPMGWKPVDVAPLAGSGIGNVELRKVTDPKESVFSGTWENPGNLRSFVFIVPGEEEGSCEMRIFRDGPAGDLAQSGRNEALPRTSDEQALVAEAQRNQEGTTPGPVVTDPADSYFQAYQLQQEANRLASLNQNEQALSKLKEAQALVQEIGTRFPDWKPEMVAQRLEKTRAELDSLAGNGAGNAGVAQNERPVPKVAQARQVIPRGATGVRFLAFDEKVQAAKINLMGERELPALITDLHPFKRSRTYVAQTASTGSVRVFLGDRKNPNGTPISLDVPLGGMTQPLILLIQNPKAPSGLAAVAIEDNPANFKWGTYRVFNASKDDLVMRVNMTNFRVPMGWIPVDITPVINGPSPVELRPMKDPKTVVYSSVWQGSPDIRRLVVIVPSPDARLGVYLPKVIPEDRTNLSEPFPIQPPADLTSNDKAADIAKSAAEALPAPLAKAPLPSESPADVALPDIAYQPPGARSNNGAGGGSGGSVGTGVAKGSGPGASGYRGAMLDGSIIPDDISPKKKALSRVADMDKSESSAERYGSLVDQPWKSPWTDALSTFSIDVDSASYTNLRRMITSGQKIPKDAVRIEECVNYFDYHYEGPKSNGPFAVQGTLVTSPLKSGNLLARVAIKGREIENKARPASNLVFLIDVSGSMQDSMKLPLLKRSMKLLIEQLDERDHLGIVVYAGNEGVALNSTALDETGKAKALKALEDLAAGGSTNGGAGIRRAYQMASEHFIAGGVNRVILATDGDFNVGTTSQGDLVDLVKEKAATGTYLTVTAYGEGNLNDSMMEAITKDGNGNYYYIDSDNEARRIFLQKLSGTLVTIAKDVKIQVEFNPGKVKAYRLLGYADRILRNEDFANDKVDAGDIGAGHTVTAFYEIVPEGAEMPNTAGLEELKYQKPAGNEVVPSDEWFTLKLRYKAPDGDTSALIETPVKGEPQSWEQAGNDMRFASAVTLFGMKLRDMPEARDMPWSKVEELVKPALAEDPQEQRAGFLELVKKLSRKD